MIANEHLTVEIASLRRRGLAAAPCAHPRRSAECPSLAILARGALTAGQQRHVRSCRHCRATRQAALRRSTYTAPATGAIAAVLIVGVLWSAWSTEAPARFPVPKTAIIEPAPRAIEAVWPAPLPSQRPRVRRMIPAAIPPLPVIRPLERFEPPKRTMQPAPVAAVAAPSPPALAPQPPPDVVGMLGLRVL
jgi:hypothetical protein